MRSGSAAQQESWLKATPGGDYKKLSSLAMSTTTFTTDLVWDTPTAELVRLNEQKLRDMGLADDVVRATMRNPWYALSVLTAFVTGLEQLQGVTGRDEVAKLAASAASEDQARFLAEAMQMLGRHHTMVEPLSTLTARGTVTARTRGGAVVVPAPVDYVAWTQRAAEFARRPDLNAQQHIVCGSQERCRLAPSANSPH